MAQELRSEMDLTRRDGAQPVAPDATLGELIGRMSADLSTLMRKEVQLAKVEIKEEVAKAGKGAGMLGGTAVAGLFGLLMLSFAAAWGLAAVMPTGLAFLIVGIAYLILAGALYFAGRNELKTVHPVPEQTAATVKEDVQWAKQQLS
jgi:uncharacterized membrane protein YqjE